MYQVSRQGIAWLAIAFPLILCIGGSISAHLNLEGSMSAYYHASPESQQWVAEHPVCLTDEAHHPECLIDPGQGVMRNWFVGLLFALGSILVLYRGFTWMEDYALNLAGVMALGVALFPMAWGPDFKGREVTVLAWDFSIHGACAVTLFLCIGYVCIFRACDTLDLIKDETVRKRYRAAYKWLGRAMIVFPFVIFVLFSYFHVRNRATFFIEAAGIWVFAAYWLEPVSKAICQWNDPARNLRSEAGERRHSHVVDAFLLAQSGPQLEGVQDGTQTATHR